MCRGLIPTFAWHFWPRPGVALHFRTLERCAVLQPHVAAVGAYLNHLGAQLAVAAALHHPNGADGRLAAVALLLDVAVRIAAHLVPGLCAATQAAIAAPCPGRWRHLCRPAEFHAAHGASLRLRLFQRARCALGEVGAFLAAILAPPPCRHPIVLTCVGLATLLTNFCLHFGAFLLVAEHCPVLTVLGPGIKLGTLHPCKPLPGDAGERTETRLFTTVAPERWLVTYPSWPMRERPNKA